VKEVTPRIRFNNSSINTHDNDSDSEESHHSNKNEVDTNSDDEDISDHLNNNNNNNEPRNNLQRDNNMNLDENSGSTNNINRSSSTSNENVVIDISAQEKHYGKKYSALTKEEINQLTTYTRKTFFRRCKFVNPGILHSHMDKFFTHMMVNDHNEKVTKTYHVMQCVKDTLSSRRGYSTTLICNKMRGKLLNSTYST
jgi:hypothetical protein